MSLYQIFQGHQTVGEDAAAAAAAGAGEPKDSKAVGGLGGEKGAPKEGDGDAFRVRDTKTMGKTLVYEGAAAIEPPVSARRTIMGRSVRTTEYPRGSWYVWSGGYVHAASCAGVHFKYGEDGTIDIDEALSSAPDEVIASFSRCYAANLNMAEELGLLFGVVDPFTDTLVEMSASDFFRAYGDRILGYNAEKRRFDDQEFARLIFVCWACKFAYMNDLGWKARSAEEYERLAKKNNTKDVILWGVSSDSGYPSIPTRLLHARNTNHAEFVDAAERQVKTRPYTVRGLALVFTARTEPGEAVYSGYGYGGSQAGRRVGAPRS